MKHYETCLSKIYTENFTSKNWKYSNKKSDMFLPKTECGYSFKLPQQGGSNEHLNLCFLAKIRKTSFKSKRKIEFKMAAMVAILDFRSELFYLFFIYQSPLCFLPSFESAGLLAQEKKLRKIDFHGPILDFQGFFGTILAIFNLQITPKLPIQVQVNWPFGSGKEVKNRFSKGPHGNYLGFWIRMTTFFDLQVTPMLPTKFESIGLLVQEKKQKIDFQDGLHGNHLGFWIRMIFTFFSSASYPNASYQVWVSWSFGSGEEGKNRFSRCPPWQPSWISDWNDLIYFWSTSYTDDSYQVSSQLAFGFWRISKTFQHGHHGSHLGFPIGNILAIFRPPSGPLWKYRFLYRFFLLKI